MLQHIGREITRETNIRDIARGCPDDGHGNAATCELRGHTYVVNPHWARLKTPGSYWINEIQRRWGEFCSEPRDPATELAKIGMTPEALPAGTGNVSALGPAIQAAISEGIKAGVAAALAAQGNGHTVISDNAMTPPTRRPGRPRKMEATVEVTT
jgi:hypothetical protein